MDLLREATIAHMSQLHLYNCPHAICRPRRCKEAGSRNTATSGPAASCSGASHTFFSPSPPSSHVRILSRSRALSCLSLSFFLHLFLSLSLSLSHTQGIFLFLSLFLCFFFRTNTRTTSTGKFCLSCSLPESLSFFLSLSFCLSHAHTYTQGNADARKHSLFRIDSRSRNHRTRLCRRHIAPQTEVRQKVDSFSSLFHITELFPSL